MAEVGTERPVAEAPLVWRPGWPFLLILPVIIPGWVNDTRWAPWPLRVVLLLGIAWYTGYWIVMAIGAQRWGVTFDGEVVAIRSRFSSTRFRREDVGSVVVPTMAPSAVLRLDEVERTMFGVRLPWPFPWRRAVTPFVPPGWFVQVVGIPASRVRPGGLRWVASRLLRRPMTAHG